MLIATDHSRILNNLKDKELNNVKLFKHMMSEPKVKQYLDAQNFQMLFIFIATYSSYYADLYTFTQYLLEETDIDYLDKLSYIPEDFFAFRSFKLMKLERDQVLKKRCFANCRIDELYLSKATTTLTGGIFEGSYIREIFLPENAVKINASAFSGIETTGNISIHVPKSVKDINIKAFAYHPSVANSNQIMNIYYGGTAEDWDKAVAKSMTGLGMQIIKKSEASSSYDAMISTLNGTNFHLFCKL